MSTRRLPGRPLAGVLLIAALSGCTTVLQDTGFAPAKDANGDASTSAAAPSDATSPEAAAAAAAKSAALEKAIAGKTDELAAAYAERAEALAQKPDPEAAIADLDHILVLEPGSGLASIVRGEIKVGKNDLTGGIADFTRAITVQLPADDGSNAASLPALHHLLAAQFPGMRPSDLANAYYLRGTTKQAQGDLAGAIADLDQAIATDADFSAAYNSRGIAKGLVRDAAGAVDDFTKAIALDPNAADAYANRGHIYIATRALEPALKDLNRAIELKPDWATAYFDRASIRQKSGDLDAAIDDLTKAISLKSDYADAYFNRALDYDRQAKLGPALDDYNKIIALRPDSADAYANRGIDRYRQNDMDAAIADFNKAISLKRDFVKAYLERAVADRIKGDTAGAIADYGKVIELSDRDTGMYPQLFRSVFMREAHGDTATQEFSDTVNSWPDSWPRRLGSYLAGSLSESDLLDQADRAEGKTASAHHCDACYFIGMNALIAGKTDAAKDFFQKCVATGRDDLFAFKFAQAELGRLSPPPPAAS
jgi:tetratricopeptide (TPR) repeat protein